MDLDLLKGHATFYLDIDMFVLDEGSLGTLLTTSCVRRLHISQWHRTPHEASFKVCNTEGHVFGKETNHGNL